MGIANGEQQGEVGMQQWSHAVFQIVARQVAREELRKLTVTFRNKDEDDDDDEEEEN